MKNDWKRSDFVMAYNPEDFTEGRTLHNFVDKDDESTSNYIHALPYLALAYTNLNRKYHRGDYSVKQVVYADTVDDIIRDYLERVFVVTEDNRIEAGKVKIDPVRALLA